MEHNGRSDNKGTEHSGFFCKGVCIIEVEHRGIPVSLESSELSVMHRPKYYGGVF